MHVFVGTTLCYIPLPFFFLHHSHSFVLTLISLLYPPYITTREFLPANRQANHIFLIPATLQTEQVSNKQTNKKKYTMKAVIIEKTGTQPVYHNATLTDIPKPKLTEDGQALLDVHAVSFNHRELWIRKGQYPVCFSFFGQPPFFLCAVTPMCVGEGRAEE